MNIFFNLIITILIISFFITWGYAIYDVVSTKFKSKNLKSNTTINLDSISEVGELCAKNLKETFKKNLYREVNQRPLLILEQRFSKINLGKISRQR